MRSGVVCILRCRDRRRQSRGKTGVHVGETEPGVYMWSFSLRRERFEVKVKPENHKGPRTVTPHGPSGPS